MLFDDLKNVVVAGQIATLQTQILAATIYGKKTGETVTPITTALNSQITGVNKV